MKRPILTDARQLDWAAAEEAAQRIVRICSDSHYVPPEDLARHQMYAQHVAEQLAAICKALMITRAP